MKAALSPVRGFTLLEIMVVLFIVILFFGMTIPSLNSLSSEQQLNEPVRQCQLLARTGRRLSLEDTQPHELLLTPTALELVSTGTDEKTGKTKYTRIERYDLPKGTHYRVKHWNQREWSNPVEDHIRFQPSGIMEPVSLRFERGKSWSEFTFNPLTAGVQDESSYFP